MLDPAVAAMVKGEIGELRAVVAACIEKGVPVPALTSALLYYDGMTRERCSANIIQAQRDCFGAHTFMRVDKEGSFHAEWSK